LQVEDELEFARAQHRQVDGSALRIRPAYLPTSRKISAKPEP
jgi:hypothetical protein